MTRKIRSSRLSRRRMLQGVGAGLAAIPFLSRLPSAHAAAPKRLLFFFTPNGPLKSQRWVPNGDGGDSFDITSMKAAHAVLNPVKDKIMCVDGLRFHTDDKESESSSRA